MSDNLVIVAIPAADDPVWKISSEKVPHLTLCFLGPVNNPSTNVERITEFVQHAIDVSEHGPFMLDVDYRGTLGPDQADVLFFRKSWDIRWINRFRNQLLQNTDIKAAYESVLDQQYPEWQPHLTMGYPATPAHPDPPDMSRGINWVSFDRIAVWTGNYAGPEFRLTWPEFDSGMEVAMSNLSADDARVALGLEALEHHGIKGMKWGVRKPPPSAVSPSARSVVPRNSLAKTQIKVEGGQNHPAHEDAIKVAEARAKLAKSGPAALSNHELQSVSKRLQLEQQVSELTKHKGQKFVTSLFKQQGQQGANAFVQKKRQTQLGF